MNSPTLNRMVSSREMYRDLDGNFRVSFSVASQGDEENKAVFDFMQEFDRVNGGNFIVYFEMDMDDPDTVKNIDIKVGYAQKFQNEFKAKFG